jgi:hypothetical protein
MCIARSGRFALWTRTAIFAVATLIFAVLIFSSPSRGADGFAVSTAYRYGQKNWAPLVPESDDPAMKGRICKFTIKNSKVVKCDTIFYGMGQYPAISWDGKRVAFFRYGIYRSNIGNTLEGLQNPVTTRLAIGQTGTDTLCGSWSDSWVSVIEANGSIRNIVKLPVRPGEENAIDWPVGDWIYYACPSTGRADRQSTEIRRVNVATGQDLSVRSGISPYVRRMTVTLDSRAVAVQCPANSIYSLPGYSSLVGFPACNVAISGSAGYVGHYMGGRHCEVILYHLDTQYKSTGLEQQPSLWDMANWNADMCFNTQDVDTVIGCEVIHWSVNSDQWLTQSMGWHGHAGNLIRGGNGVLMNWVDREALCIGNNPRIYGVDPLYYGNNGGDFFLDLPVGRYEDSTGRLVLMPNLPLTLSADTAALTSTASSQTVTATFAQGAAAVALTASSNAAWLTASVSGSTIQATANTAGLAPGNYAGRVTVSGGSLENSFTVTLRVAGTPALTILALVRDTLCAQVNGTVQFAAKTLDQFGQTIAATVNWSVAGGGSINPSGLFASSGALGSFRVIAASGTLADTGYVVVTTNKSIPLNGYLTELLCLENSGGSPYLPLADSGGIASAHTGATRTIPADGIQVTVNGHVYTWKLLTDADGKWADSNSYTPFVAYWYTTLQSQQTRRAQIITRHMAHFAAWCNGSVLTNRQPFAAFHEDWASQFAITPQGQGIFMKLHNEWGGNLLMVRFADPATGQPLGRVQYCPPGTPTEAGSPVGTTTRRADPVMCTRRHIRIDLAAGHAWSVSICRLDGTIIRSYSGREDGRLTIPTSGLSAGMYLLKVRADGRRSVRRFVVW